MSRAAFEAARQHMLAMLRDWIARGADLVEVEQETQATAAAMRQLAHLAQQRAKARESA